MFYSAVGYLLTLFMAFTIIPLIAFFLRMILIMLLSRIYWGMSSDKSPVSVLKFSVKIAQPVGFITAIFHGYAALWMGVVFLKGLSIDLDFFLPILLGFSFIWFGIRRIQNPEEVKLENKITTTNSDGEETTIILNPEEENSIQETPFGENQNPMKEFNKQMQDQLKEQTKEFLHGNTVIGLIGKVTGVAIATMSLIVPFLS